jgi:hypothetical protein
MSSVYAISENHPIHRMVHRIDSTVPKTSFERFGKYNNDNYSSRP